jgi:hypothetical protein
VAAATLDSTTTMGRGSTAGRGTLGSGRTQRDGDPRTSRGGIYHGNEETAGAHRSYCAAFTFLSLKAELLSLDKLNF